ncbi:MAG: DUF1186 domain-containing protein [Verrucomicrobia bacterium]|nr:DUF1186 domain-containing protein [Verrucomicrobiota bacterium]
MHESPEPILQSLRQPQKLPVEALKAANSNRARLAPLLIQELQKFSADYQRCDPNDCLAMIAIYLLAEWEECDAFETVLECFALDDRYGGYELGDLITEDGPAILAALCRGDLDALERFTERKDISGWARGAAFKAMVVLVLWGKVPRENVVTRFAWIFRRKPFSREDKITWTELADAAFELHPAELMDEIRPLFRQGIVDPVATTLDEFEREAKRDRATCLRRNSERFRPITDTARSISCWGQWNDPSAKRNFDTAHASYPQEKLSAVPTRSTAKKVGRNDPCPCGSGKKYKQCCGKLPR